MSTTLTPRIDIHEYNDQWVVDADLPGANADHISITIEDGVLILSATIADSDDDGFTTVHREWRTPSEGHFERRIQLGELSKQLSADDLNATYEHGVLSLTIRKPVPKQPVRIAIQPH